MCPAAPRIDPRLIAALALLDDRTTPIAETNRRLGELARHFGLTRPSYEQVRVHVHAVRARLSRRTRGTIRLRVALQISPPAGLFDLAPRRRVRPPRRT